MTVRPNSGNYLRSISCELSAAMDRVRNLIGDKHWLSDGHHKEHLFNSVLARFLPSGFFALRGFVVNDHTLSACSNEQDVLIVDARESVPLFQSSGLVISFPENVVMAISVKTTLDPQTLKDSLLGLNSIPLGSSLHPTNLGVFAFSLSDPWREKPDLSAKWLTANAPELLSQHLREGCGAQELNICANNGFYVHGDMTCDLNHDAPWVGQDSGELSAAIFIARIVELIRDRCGNTTRSINDLLIDYEAPPLFTNRERHGDRRT